MFYNIKKRKYMIQTIKFIIIVVFIPLFVISCAQLYEENGIAMDLADLNCTSCHKGNEYPPTSGRHTKHIVEIEKDCADCHFTSVQCTTLIYITGDNDSTYVFQQLNQVLDNNDTVAIPNIKSHINQRFDIIFKSRVRDSLSTTFEFNPDDLVYNSKRKSCSSMESCHKPHMKETEFWEEDN